MKIYLVGGAVRDRLLGLPIKERDWVVVGATVNDMLSQGFRQVGKEFPVFLHPKSYEEYALARKERKTKPGYQGFDFDASPEVTLQNDLIRRDLTINAMAQTLEGDIIDPYGGQADLKNKLLRHVSDAFGEDPVRILRAGRFLARFHQYGFSIAKETTALMTKMVANGEVNALVAERVWKELQRALTEPNPECFFQVLADCGALAILFPDISMTGLGMQALITVTAISQSPAIRFATLLYNTSHDYITAIANRYRIPNEYKKLSLVVKQFYRPALQSQQFSAEALLKFFSRIDIFRHGKRFQHFLIAVEAIAKVENHAFCQHYLATRAAALKALDIKPLLAAGLKSNAFANALREARLTCLKQLTQE
jgi:tRNA nucleotidyltransferase (CCA-adding enzyme)